MRTCSAPWTVKCRSIFSFWLRRLPYCLHGLTKPLHLICFFVIDSSVIFWKRLLLAPSFKHVHLTVHYVGMSPRKHGNRRQQTSSPAFIIPHAADQQATAAPRMSSSLTAPMRNLLPCTRRQSQMSWRHLANTLEVYDYLPQHGVHVDTTNATHYRVHYEKTWRHPQNRK